MNQNFRQCIGIFLTTVAFGVLLRCGYQLYPHSLLRLIAPCGTSVWELTKIALVPSVLSTLLYHIGRHDRGSLCAYLMVPAAMPAALLFIYWFLRMVCGICSGLLDTSIWIALTAIACLTASAVRETDFARRALFMVCMILFVWFFVYILFTLRPVDLPIFAETMPRPAFAHMTC